MSNEPSETQSDGRYAVALPCEPDQFSNFIGSLLGKPQTISKTYGGSFEIGHQDIENAYQLVLQRVKQQNQSSLVQFTVRLVYDDNSTVLLNSFEDFQSYSEVRPLVVVQAHLSWSFLVKFEDREYPEKQEIDLSFVASNHPEFYIHSAAASMPMAVRRFVMDGGSISFRVSHTARTWGADLESLLSGHAQHVLLPESKTRKFVRTHSGTIAFCLAASFFILTLIACFYTADKIGEEQIAMLTASIEDPQNVSAKLDVLLTWLADGFWGRFFFSVFVFTIASLIIAILLATWAEDSANAHKPSYILLTKKTEQHKEQADLRYAREWLSFLASIFTGVATGVIANIIFNLYWVGAT